MILPCIREPTSIRNWVTSCGLILFFVTKNMIGEIIDENSGFVLTELVDGSSGERINAKFIEKK